MAEGLPRDSGEQAIGVKKRAASNGHEQPGEIPWNQNMDELGLSQNDETTTEQYPYDKDTGNGLLRLQVIFDRIGPET